MMNTTVLRAVVLLIAFVPAVFAAANSDDGYDLCPELDGEEFVIVPDATVGDFTSENVTYLQLADEDWSDFEEEGNAVTGHDVTNVRLERDNESEERSSVAVEEEHDSDLSVNEMSTDSATMGFSATRNALEELESKDCDALRDAATQTPTLRQSELSAEHEIFESVAQSEEEIAHSRIIPAEVSAPANFSSSPSPAITESGVSSAKDGKTQLSNDSAHAELKTAQPTAAAKNRLTKRERREAAIAAEAEKRAERDRNELQRMAMQYLKTRMMHRVFIPATPEIQRVHYFLRNDLVLIVTLADEKHEKAKLLFAAKPANWAKTIPANVRVFA